MTSPTCQDPWSTLEISALGRLGQEDQEFGTIEVPRHALSIMPGLTFILLNKSKPCSGEGTTFEMFANGYNISEKLSGTCL